MNVGKIILGSANLGSNYGLRERKIEIKEFSKLISFAFNKGIKHIDTSAGYYNSEKIIGSSKKKFSVITKISKIPNKLKNTEIDKWITNQVKKSKKKLKNKIIYGLLLQNAKILLETRGKKIFSTLLKLKKLGYFKKLGVSVYDFKTLEKIIKKYDIDIAQLPYNVLDQRESSKRLFFKLKRKKIEIHARSIFLQGLLLEKNIKLKKKKFKELNTILIQWNNWLNKKKIKNINACMNFVFQNKNIDKIVIGFDSLDNLKEIINVINMQEKFKFDDLNLRFNYKAIDPRNWN